MAVTQKADRMRSVNEGLASLAAGFAPTEAVWVFVCECGAADCAGRTELELSTYEDLRTDPEKSVLAEGHVASPAQRARREAAGLREEARALQGQAELQRSRAQRLLG